MTNYINRVILIGRLGRDAEVKALPTGASIVNLNIATSERWKDKANGQWKEKTEWHRATIFGNHTDAAALLRKGDEVFIEGKMTTRSWEKDGQKHYATEVHVQAPNHIVAAFTGAPPRERQASAERAADPFDDEIPF